MTPRLEAVAEAPRPSRDLTVAQLADALGDIENAYEDLKAERERVHKVVVLRGLFSLTGCAGSSPARSAVRTG